MDFPPIYGFNECSEMGNDIFAPSIFLGRCNLRCPYCMNSKLIKPQNDFQVDYVDIQKYIRKNNSKWIMVSGGEPTCVNTKLLQNLFSMFIGMGCKIGMSTNGTNTQVLTDVLSMLNYVAIDIKSPKSEVYNSIGEDADAFFNVLYSRCLLFDEKEDREDFDYELRTTLYPDYIDESALKEIGVIVMSDDKWVLQQFRHTSNMFSKEAYDIEPYSEDEIKELLKIAQSFTSKAELKYV